MKNMPSQNHLQSIRLGNASSRDHGGENMDNDDENEQSFTITDEQHYRSSLIAVGKMLHLPDEQQVTTSDDDVMLDTSLSIIVGEATKEGDLESLQPKHAESFTAFDEPSDERTSLLLRSRQQVSSRTAEIRLLQSALEEVDRIAAKRAADGLNEINFTIGVVNTMLVVFVLGVYPQHFWLLYLIEGLYLLPSRFMANTRTKPLNSALFFLDFCWVMNALALVILAVFALESAIGISGNEAIHRQIFLAAVGIACGPLLGATAVLPFCCLMFHDANTLAGFYIHMFPPCVMYTFVWHAAEIKEAWPSIFFLDYLVEIQFFPSSGEKWWLALGYIAGNAVVLYAVWWILYLAFMLVKGMDLPRYDRRKADGTIIRPIFDTCFHNFERAGLAIMIGSTLWKRPKETSKEQMRNNHYEVRDLLAYMFAHAVAAFSSIFILGYPCYHSRKLHASFLFFVAIVTTWRGAKRYTYYTTAMYGKAIRKQFAHLIDEENQKSKRSLA